MEKIYYGPLELPSGTVIRFRRPTGMDKILVTKKAKMSADRLNDLVLIQQFVAAKCITEIDDKPAGPDYQSTFESMDGLDWDYYYSLFDEMFAITDERKDEIKEKARFLLENCNLQSSSK
ncbi:hypothetical protein [uncultured Phascolarctobacterium sp.]|uniref:hypothetical protein n=1 Tax=uncultured Phascolarctobacterium sp. TaxID=512296 RepID=UPI0026276B6E|nr:hypothetical protein [uncultured Phascolarctobacterium sp.]